MNNLSTSLLITLIGMGLVFVGILVLWAVMEILVRATAKSEQEVPTEEIQEEPAASRKRAAAAAAVSVALAKQHSKPSTFTLNRQENTHAWQAVMRAGQLNSVSQFSLRKPRGK